MVKLYQSWTYEKNEAASSDKDNRGDFLYVILQFENLAGVTGPDGNVLFTVYRGTAPALLIDNKVLNLKIPAPRGIYQFLWF